MVSPLHLLELQLEGIVEVHQPLVAGPHHPVLSEALDRALQCFLSFPKQPELPNIKYKELNTHNKHTGGLLVQQSEARREVVCKMK